MNETNEIRYMLKDHVGTAVCLERALAIIDNLAARVAALEQNADADARKLAEHDDALSRILAAVPSAATPNPEERCYCGHIRAAHECDPSEPGVCVECGCNYFAPAAAPAGDAVAGSADAVTLPATVKDYTGDYITVKPLGTTHPGYVNVRVAELDPGATAFVSLDLTRLDALIRALQAARAVAAAGGVA